ncbi:MAG: molybdenum cofactor guanylyltransferase MobA [Pseudomonadota bacterium]
MSLPLGVILAGGQARRMGGRDKPLLTLAGQALIAHVAARLAPQTAGLIISANGDPARFSALGLTVIADASPGQGPLGGVLAGLQHAQALGHRSIVTAPADTPFLPRDLVRGLRAAAYAQDSAFAYAEGRVGPGAYVPHPVCALWPVTARPMLEAALADGRRAVGPALDAAGAARIAFSAAPRDPFFNINTPEDLARAEDMLERS